MTAATAAPAWLAPAAAALRNADCLLYHAGAGMGVDSGLPDFRGPQGFWKAYPPMQHLGLNFQDCSNPRSFQADPAFGWGFFGHRYHLYRAAEPHSGYSALRRWAGRARLGHFVFTSNVDGGFLKAGFDEDRVVECHGSIHFLQPFENPRRGAGRAPAASGRMIWPASPALDHLEVDPVTFMASQPLPTCPPETGAAAGTLARPNILMFGDWGWDETRTEAQTERREIFLDGLPRAARVVVIEIGAGLGVPTVRYESEGILDRFPSATLLRVNPSEPEGPEGTISIPMGGKAALEMLDREIGGEGGIGSGGARARA